MKKSSKKKGFTLIELIVVIAILGILAAVLIPRFTGFQDKAKSTKALVDAKNIATAIDAYYIENTAYPANDEAGKKAMLKIAIDDDTNFAGLDFTNIASGGFVWTVNGTTYKAGRTAANQPVKMNP